eukprot:TRINITY_DN407_c3_g2_i1.p1 TRINITY_DN407_c3_g2~~TRINITY_DN407_c3_g2_i1.p1  ORF type:complete len:808 (+),score=135.85 TRINITY_DN407_c3_g2_i1:150-2573(+)
MWPLLLLALVAGAAASGSHDEISNRSYSTINIALLAVFSGSIGVLVLALVLVRGFGKRIRGPVVIIVSLWATVVASTVSAWSVVYQITRDTIEDQASHLLIASADRITVGIENDVFTAIYMLELLQNNFNTNIISIDSGYPHVQSYLSSLYTTIARAAPSIELIFCGTDQGEIHGVGSNQRGMTHIIIGLAPNELIPYCITASPDRLEVSDPPVCTARNESSFLIFNSTGDVLIDNMLEDELLAHHNFDAKTRPWWTASNISWTDPYPYEMGGIGITVSKAIFTPNGDHFGAFGIDFSWKSFKVLMIPPTDNADVIVSIPSNGSHILLTSSIPNEDLDILCHDPQSGSSVVKVEDCQSRVSKPHRILFEEVSSVNDMESGRYVFLDDGRDIVLAYPLKFVGGLELLIVITVPYLDLMGETEAAYTTALLIGVVTSFVFGGFIYVGVSMTLIPLRHLALDMSEVAYLRLDDLRVRNPSIVYEINWMQESFSKMVANLVEYRAYLPQSVMLDKIESDDLETERQSTHPDKSSIMSVTSADTIDFRGAKVVPVNNLDGLMKLVRRSVSLLACNIRNFNSFTRRYEVDELASIHTNYLSRVVAAAADHCGVIDSFNCDRVTVSFNAVRQCQDHRKAVARCAVDMSRAFKVIKLDVSLGCAGGEGICGPLGYTEMKKNCVVGAVSTNVHCIERYGCRNKIKVSCDQQIATSTSGCADTRKVAFIRLPNSKRATILYEIHGLQTNTDWMFDAAMPPIFEKYYHYNLAFDLMWEGNATEAMETLSLSSLKPYDDLLREQIERSIDRPPEVITMY